jgi:hypothetical protein
MPEINDGTKPQQPPTPLSIQNVKLGLAMRFVPPAQLSPRKIGEILKDEMPAIKRFLDDPVNWPTIGRTPPPDRNALLAMILSADRIGCSDLAIIPIDRVCDVACHAPNYQGKPCPLCNVIRIVNLLGSENLLRITSITGEADEKGHYLWANIIMVSPDKNLEVYRDKIRRLALPALLELAGGDSAATTSSPKEIQKALSILRLESWQRTTIEVAADTFKIGGVIGHPKDLGINEDEWKILISFAQSRGDYAPKLLGHAAMEFRETVMNLADKLSDALPQLHGLPFRQTTHGNFEPVFTAKSVRRTASGGW